MSEKRWLAAACARTGFPAGGGAAHKPRPPKPNQTVDKEAVLRIRDPVPFLTPKSGMGKKSGSGSGMNNPDHISESLKSIFCAKIPIFFYVDLGWKIFGSGIRSTARGFQRSPRGIDLLPIRIRMFMLMPIQIRIRIGIQTIPTLMRILLKV
jgi:hypothetical protein